MLTQILLVLALCPLTLHQQPSISIISTSTIYGQLQSDQSYSLYNLNYGTLIDVDRDQNYTIVCEIQILSNQFLPVGLYLSSQIINPSDISNPGNFVQNSMDFISIYNHARSQIVSTSVSGAYILDNPSYKIYIVWLDITSLPYITNNDIAITFDEQLNIISQNKLNFKLTVDLHHSHYQQQVICENGQLVEAACVCQNGYYGSYCEHQMEKITVLNTKQIVIVPAQQHKSFIIQISPQQLRTKSQEDQFESIQIQISCKNNDDLIFMWRNESLSLSNNQMIPTTIFNQNSPLQINSISIDPTKQRIILTLFSGSSASIVQLNVFKKYTEEQKIILVVVAVSLIIGSIFLLTLLFYCIYCRGFYYRSWAHTAVPAHPRIIAPFLQNNAIANYHINDDEYFPEITYKQFIQQIIRPNLEEGSQSQEHIPNNSCAICLQYFEMSSSEALRYTFCNHLFHGKCFIQWKSRQASCPLCRQELLLPVANSYMKKAQKMSAQSSRICQGIYQKYFAIYNWHNVSKKNKQSLNGEFTSHNLIKPRN